MKPNHKKTILLLAALAFVAGGLKCSAQSLSVTPSMTSNSYAGFITLNATGLQTGEKVVINKYLDLNGNGVIDPGEPLVDTFKIQDGGAMVIGGVTNVSVPYDSNPAGGAITASLNFCPDLVLENMVASYVYQMVSPSNRFTPVIATFSVTNGIQGQTISGTVYSNGVPFPYGIVVAQDQQANNVAGGIVADASGHYSLSLPASSYSLIAACPGMYYDFSSAPSITLTNGASVTANLYETNGNETTVVSGSFYDSVSSNGIGGLLFTMQSGSLFTINFSADNGSFSVPVPPSFWKLSYAKQRLARRAYVVTDSNFQEDTTHGSVSNANIPLYKATALFYGRVTDNSNHPMPNVEFDANANLSNGSNLDGKGYSDANGYFGVAALGDETNQWSCEINSGKGTALANYVVNSYNMTNLNTNQSVLENFTALPAIGQILGHAQDNSGNPVVGVLMLGSATINGDQYNTLDSTTDNSGNFTIPVAAGTWDIHFNVGGFSDSLDTKGYVDYTSDHYVTIPPTNAPLNLTVYPIGTPFISYPQRLSSSSFGFNLSGASKVSYTIQVSANPASTNWTSIYSLILTNSTTYLIDNTASNGMRFYRAKKN